MCKSTVCVVEAYRVNACIKAENTWKAKYNVRNFKDLSVRRQQQCYRYMEEKQGRLQELMHMEHYQQGRKRRQLRLMDAYFERRHEQRHFEKMKSLAGVPDRNELAHDVDMYTSFGDSYGVSEESTQTVIRKPSKSSASLNISNDQNVIEANVAISSSSDALIVRRFNDYDSPDIIIEYEVETSENETIATCGSAEESDFDDSDDEPCEPEALQRLDFHLFKSPASSTYSTQKTRSTQSQSESEGQTYSQFEATDVVTSTQNNFS